MRRHISAPLLVCGFVLAQFAVPAAGWVGFHGGGFGGRGGFGGGFGSADFRGGGGPSFRDGSGSVDYRGGSASWSDGSGTATYRGGSASWSDGSGSATYRGGDASWSHGSGEATGVDGDSVRWNPNKVTVTNAEGQQTTFDRHDDTGNTVDINRTYNTNVYGYAGPPVAVYGGGYGYGCCYGEAAVAAGMTGLAVGAMAASAASRPVTTEVVTVPTTMVIGAQYSTLPAGCVSTLVAGRQYYQCGGNWLVPYFGNAGVYYQVVPAP